MSIVTEEDIIQALEDGEKYRSELERAVFDGQTHCPECGRETREFEQAQEEIQEKIRSLLYDGKIAQTPGGRFLLA